MNKTEIQNYIYIYILHLEYSLLKQRVLCGALGLNFLFKPITFHIFFPNKSHKLF